MDGASKFVRGDAVAGIMITFINIIGGMIIGMAQNGLTFTQAADFYTKLTVGDGLVTQIPALIVSTAAGMLVTKAGLQQATDKALFGQLASYPKALGLTSGLLIALSLLPDMPMAPFLILAMITGSMAYFLSKNERVRIADAATAAAAAMPDVPPVEEPISTALKIDNVRLELGYGLLSMINSPRGQRLTDQIKALRRALAAEMGFVMPSVRIQDNMQLPANTYVVFIKEVEAGRGDLRPNMLLVMDPRGEDITLPGEKTKEPTFGLPAVWIEADQPRGSPVPRLYRGGSGDRHHHPSDRGDQGPYVRAAVLLGNPEAAGRDGQAEPEAGRRSDPQLDLAGRRAAGAAEPVAGARLDPRPQLHPRRHLRGLQPYPQRHDHHRACAHPPCPPDLRRQYRLRRAISRWSPCRRNGSRPLSTPCKARARNANWSWPRRKLQEFITKTRQTFERFAMQGESPVLLTSPAIRPYVRSIIERFRPLTVVMAQSEIHPKAKIKTVGQL